MVLSRAQVLVTTLCVAGFSIALVPYLHVQLPAVT